MIERRGYQPQMANDGYRPQLAGGNKPQSVSFPKKVQGGYQGPSGGGKPPTPSTGSGVKPAAPASGNKK